MASGSSQLEEFHWLMDMVRVLDVGLVVFDRQYKVRVWNDFMVNHSGKAPHEVLGKNLFEQFSSIPEDWFKQKAESVFLLKIRAFTTWEQRPYLFRFLNYRPITGTADFMYQNIALLPLVSVDGKINQIGVIINDVTDIAVGKMQLEKANSKLETLSKVDGLTQLFNRRHWEDCLSAEFKRMKRTGEECTLCVFDIDHFKNVNDTYGHQAGDEVIRETSRLLRDCKRETDIAGRYGGEEFAVILIDTEARGARIFAERLRKKIENLTVVYEGVEIKYTISLGLSNSGDGMKDYEHWFECSDRALYEAKESGRNKTVIYAPPKEKAD